MSVLITSAEQVTQEWLEAVLQARGDLPNGQIASFAKKASKPFGSATVQIEVDYGQTTGPELPTRFLLKIDGPNSPAGNREVAFYTRFNSALSRSHTARCFDAVYDDTQRAYHVLLEDLAETHYTMAREAPPTQAEAEAMIDTLAVLHADWWGKLDDDVRLIDSDLLTEPSDAYFSQFVDFMGERLTAQRRKIYERILQNLPVLLKNRLDSAVTLVHDDAHPWNFLHPRELEKYHAVMVDWQQWGRSIGAHDVAYHISLFWYPDHRRRQEQAMVRRYHTGLVNHGVHNYAFEACWYDYRLYVLRNMLVPIWAFCMGHWLPHRWMQIEKSWFAFDDLSCMELLG